MDWDRSNLVKGSYSLQGNIVTAVFKKKPAPAEPLSRFRRKKDQNNNTGSTIAEQIFHAVRPLFFIYHKIGGGVAGGAFGDFKILCQL